MKTKEKNVTREMLFILSFVAFLVFCSFMVSYRITDILYFLVIVSYEIYYVVIRSKDSDDKESIR